MKQYQIRYQTYVTPEETSDLEEVYALENPQGFLCGYIHEERLAEVICTLLNEHARHE